MSRPTSWASARSLRSLLSISAPQDLQDPDVSGRWDYSVVPDVLTQLLEQEPTSGLDRRVPANWESQGP
jgi:hypothetical protein